MLGEMRAGWVICELCFYLYVFKGFKCVFCSVLCVIYHQVRKVADKSCFCQRGVRNERNVLSVLAGDRPQGGVLTILSDNVVREAVGER